MGEKNQSTLIFRLLSLTENALQCARHNDLAGLDNYLRRRWGLISDMSDLMKTYRCASELRTGMQQLLWKNAQLESILKSQSEELHAELRKLRKARNVKTGFGIIRRTGAKLIDHKA